MDIERINLNDSKQNRIYIILTVILVILSIAGIILFFLIKKSSIVESVVIEELPIATIAPTDIPSPIPSLIASASATVTPKLSPTIKLSPTQIATATPTIKLPSNSPTPKPTVTNLPSAMPTPTTPASSDSLINFEKTEDGFSVSYSSLRKLYQDTEASGHRYTFYSSKGNFAVHIGTNGWSWVYPDRQFSSNFLISGKPTFRYDISTQTIVDVENNNIKYTLQCVHNGNTDLKAECESFINSFKLL